MVCGAAVCRSSRAHRSSRVDPRANGHVAHVVRADLLAVLLARLSPRWPWQSPRSPGRLAGRAVLQGAGFGPAPWLRGAARARRTQADSLSLGAVALARLGCGARRVLCG